jgi:hypothetical protein
MKKKIITIKQFIIFESNQIIIFLFLSNKTNKCVFIFINYKFKNASK